MNIAITVSKLTLSGGMERYSIDLIRGFNELGVIPYVFTAKYDPSLLSQVKFKPVVVHKPRWLGKLGIYIFNYQLKFIKRKYKIDYLIACNRNAHSDIAMCGGTHLGYLKALDRSPKFWDRLEIALEKKLYANAKYVIAHSKQMAKELQQFYRIDSSKLQVLYPPINDSVFVPISNSQRELLRRDNNWLVDDIILLFPSSGHERKGLSHIIAAIKQSQLKQRIKLIVLGKYNSQYAEDFVYFQNFRNDIEKLYQSVDFTILASNYEPFGLVGPESVLCGTPCIFTKTIGATEILSKESCHVFTLEQEGTHLVDILNKSDKLKIRLQDEKSHIDYDISLKNHTNKIISLISDTRRL